MERQLIIASVLVLFASVTSKNLSKKVAIFPPEYWIESATNNIWILSEDNVTVFASLNNGFRTISEVERDILAGDITNISWPPFDHTLIIADDKTTVYRLTVRIKTRLESFVEDFYIENRPEIRWIEIFTDKPIYRQKETVQVKIVALTANLSAPSSSLLICVKDAEGFTVFKTVFNDTGQSNGLVEFSLILSRHSSCGKWLIEATDFRSKLLVINKTFDVAVYALPNLQVVIDPSKAHFNNLNDSINLMISVQSNYGFGVNGKAQVMCHFETRLNKRFSVQLLQGKGSLNFRPSECIFNVPHSKVEKLYVNAEYTDLDTGEQSYHSIILVKKTLSDLTFDAEILRFGLGGAEILPILVRLKNFRDDETDDRLYEIKTSVSCLKYRMERIKLLKEYKTRISIQNSSEIFHIDVPRQESCFAVHLKMNSSLNGESHSIVEHLISRTFDKQSPYLNFSKFEFEVTDVIEAFVVDERFGSLNYSYLLYCLNGFTLMGKISQSNPFHLKVNVSMIPECLLILYELSNNGLPIVKDILKFLVKSMCDEKHDVRKVCISLSHFSLIVFTYFWIRMNFSPTSITGYKPGSKFTAKLENVKDRLVLINAYDKRLDLIEPGHAKNDFFIVGPLRDLYDSFIQKKISNVKNVDHLLNDTDQLCCNAGLTFWQIKKACPILNRLNSEFFDNCQRKFYKCCSKTSSTRPFPSCQNDRNCYKARTESIAASGSEFPGLEVISEPRMVAESRDESLKRHLFPESWIFETYRPQGHESSIMVERTIPHSITDWIFRIYTFSSQYGYCNKRFSIKTSQNLYSLVNLPTNVFVGQQILAKVVIVNPSPKNEHVSLEIRHTRDICSAKPLFDVHETSVGARNSTFVIVPFEFLSEGQFEIEMVLKSRNDPGLIFDHLIKSVDVTFDSSQWEQKSLNFMIDADLSANDYSQNFNDGIFEISSSIANRSGRLVNVVGVLLKKKKPILIQGIKLHMSVSPNLLKYEDSGVIEHENRFLLKLVKRELWPKVEKVDQLSNLLRLIPIVMKIVNICETDIKASRQLLIESRQLLNYAMLDMLSFRNRDGSFRSRRNAKSKTDSWLSLISTLHQCRTGQDPTAVKTSINWLVDSYEKAKFEFNDITFLFKASDEILLFSTIFLKMVDECIRFANKDTNINVRLNSTINMIRTRLYSVDFRSVDNLIISSMAYTLADSNSSFSVKVLELLDDSARSNGRFRRIYYKPKSSSTFEKLKHTARRWLSWFASSYRKRLSANEVLTNSLTLSTVLKTEQLIHSGRNINTPDMLAYIRMNQQVDEGFNDFLDTFFALEAMQLYDRKKYRTNVEVLPKLSINFECGAKCDIPTVILDNSTPIQIRSIDFRDRHTFHLIVSGQGAASIKVIYRTKSTDFGSVTDSPNMHVRFDSKVRDNGTVDHEICFEVTDASATSFTVEHTLQRHLNYVPNSMDFNWKNSTIISHEATTYGLNIFVENAETNVRYCYVFKTMYNNALVSFSHSLIPMVIARHHVLGIIGAKRLYDEDRNLPIIEKHCNAEGTTCWCLESRGLIFSLIGESYSVILVTCPNPDVQSDQCDKLCRDHHDRILLKYACNEEFYGAVVKIEQVFPNVNIYGSLYENISVSVMGSLSARTVQVNHSDKISLLKKAFCACPKFEEDRVYVLIVPKDYILRQMYDSNDEKRYKKENICWKNTSNHENFGFFSLIEFSLNKFSRFTPDNEKPLLIVLDSNTIMEAVFDSACDNTRQMNVLKLLEGRNRSVLCQSI